MAYFIAKTIFKMILSDQSALKRAFLMYKLDAYTQAILFSLGTCCNLFLLRFQSWFKGCCHDEQKKENLTTTFCLLL